MKQEKENKERPGDGCPVEGREDLGKIQGRSIDLWEFSVQECRTMRGNGRRMKTGEMRLWDRG